MIYKEIKSNRAVTPGRLKLHDLHNYYKILEAERRGCMMIARFHYKGGSCPSCCVYTARCVDFYSALQVKN